MFLTGGGGLLRGLDMLLAQECEVPVHVAERPLETVVLGAGAMLEHLEDYRSAFQLVRPRSPGDGLKRSVVRWGERRPGGRHRAPEQRRSASVDQDAQAPHRPITWPRWRPSSRGSHDDRPARSRIVGPLGHLDPPARVGARPARPTDGFAPAIGRGIDRRRPRARARRCGSSRRSR